MTASDIIAKLELHGSESIKKVLIRHGAREPFFGVKIEDLKKIVKEVRRVLGVKGVQGVGEQMGDADHGIHQLALDLYDTGISDAMYLAGLLVDPKRMDRETLQKWVDGAYWYMLSDFTVAWVAAESRIGWEMGLEWTSSGREYTASAGWATLSGVVAITPDGELDIPKLKELVNLIGRTIHQAPNRVRHSMNSFIIAVSAYVPQITPLGKSVAQAIGKVTVDMGGTACKVPFAPDYISKIEQMGRIGRKRKTVIC